MESLQIMLSILCRSASNKIIVKAEFIAYKLSGICRINGRYSVFKTRSTNQLSTAAFVELLRSSCLLIPSEYYIYQMCERWLLAQEKNAVDILRKRLQNWRINHTIWTIWAISYESYSSNNTDYNRKKVW